MHSQVKLTLFCFLIKFRFLNLFLPNGLNYMRKFMHCRYLLYAKIMVVFSAKRDRHK